MHASRGDSGLIDIHVKRIQYIIYLLSAIQTGYVLHDWKSIFCLYHLGYKRLKCWSTIRIASDENRMEIFFYRIEKYLLIEWQKKQHKFSWFVLILDHSETY